MANEALADMLQTQPFAPFKMHLTDGRSFLVDHPDFIARSRSGRTVVLYGKGEHFEVLDLMLVTSLERVNGHPRSEPRP